jgi:hypothetical protein
MTVPSLVNAGTGATDAGGAWTYTCQASAAAGGLFIVQVLQDGATTNAITVTSGTNIEDLAGTDNVWSAFTAAAGEAVGSPRAGGQYMWMGRALSTSAPTVTGGNSTAEDIYIRSYQFADVTSGTLISDITEGVATSVGTSATVSDAGVTTLGSDRLAVNFGAITDDASGIALFAGATGGTWAHFQLYETATGTDGSLFYEDADMAAAGTINGGTDTITSLPWGVLGFALIGTASAPAPLPRPINTEMQAVNRSNVY